MPLSLYLHSDQQQQWQSSISNTVVADLVTGTCPPGTLAVYRVWNARADTNHRYTTSTAVRATMVNAGWIAEGYGPAQVIMCAAT
ncbi:MAG: hypothetical protein ABIO63_11640 [Casimicrobiaceae bacterium]